jgi:hypothetical protein
VGLECFAVKNTQSLRSFSRPFKKTEKIIRRDKRKTMALSIFFKKKRLNTLRRPLTITTIS